jgi:outer membrane receptor protein involved in Fe transport
MNICRDLSRYLYLALGAGVISAQTISISGTVTDTQAVLPGVAVTLRSDAIPARSTMTDAQGTFLFEGVTAGSYDLTFTREGFEGVTRTILITTNSATVDLALRPGAMFTRVEVTDVAGKATASRMDIPDRELPVQVSSISDDVIREQGANDLVNALKNASGVSARRFYGIYEYYTVRGFSQSDVQLVDGMKLEGNRINTQLNNVEQVEVLKGPSSILYGGQALSGAINIIRKKPQGIRAYDFFYRGGRWNLQ